MTREPLEIVRAILSDPTNTDLVGSLVAADATYVSLNYDNPDLKKLMPWAGTSYGPGSIVKTFVDVGKFWKTEAFEMRDSFSSGENVAIFGSMTYRSTVLGKKVTSPFAIFAKVKDGKVTYMQFMEDTFATGASFRSEGTWHFRSDPAGGEVTVGDG